METGCTPMVTEYFQKTSLLTSRRFQVPRKGCLALFHVLLLPPGAVQYCIDWGPSAFRSQELG